MLLLHSSFCLLSTKPHCFLSVISYTYYTIISFQQKVHTVVSVVTKQHLWCHDLSKRSKLKCTGFGKLAKLTRLRTKHIMKYSFL